MKNKEMTKIRGSIIVAILESYDVVKRQLCLFENLLVSHPEIELLFVDDGSDPPLMQIVGWPHFKNFQWVQTFDSRPWSQPCARNTGAHYARGEYILFTDIDHILSMEAIDQLCTFDGDKMHFPRQYGVLQENGSITRDRDVLLSYGCKEKDLGYSGSHENTFIIRKALFEKLGGYDQRFCGKYGGDDTDFNRRYGKLHEQGGAKRSVRGPMIHVFPDPRQDVKNIFHSLRKKV